MELLSFSRLIFLLHRYFGIGLGLIVTLWCLSGFVMMYVPYPAVSAEERLAATPLLNLEDCCAVPSLDEFSDIDIGGARVTMWPSGPTLFLAGQFGSQYGIDLQTSEYIFEITPQQAEQNARQFSQESGSGTSLEFIELLERDQWTFTADYDPHRPFYLYEVLDGRGTRLYVSSISGDVVMDSTRAERGWNWVGAVVHWLYPQILRSNTQVWFWVVVVLTCLSLFLTITGIYVAIKYLNFKKGARLSPFKGWGLWHHYIGLVFGLLTLTWLISGLLSVEPFSALQGRSTVYERSVAQGAPFIFDEGIRQSLRQLPNASLPADTLNVEYAMAAGQLSAVTVNKSGDRIRYQPYTWQPQPLSQNYFPAIAENIRPDIEISSQGWIDQEDSYYYSRRTDPALPAYRVIYADGERAYFDGVTGELNYYITVPRQWNRWLFNGLHSLDFNNFIRQRPFWDILLWLTLGGVTAGSITGTWIGWKRLTKR